MPDSAHYLPGWIADWRDRERDIDRAAVLPEENPLERTDADSVPDRPEDLAQFVAAAGWSENGSVLSDDFLARITEQHFGAPVPTDDGAVQAYAVNRVVRRFHDRGQQSPGLLGLLPL